MKNLSIIVFGLVLVAGNTLFITPHYPRGLCIGLYAALIACPLLSICITALDHLYPKE